MQIDVEVDPYEGGLEGKPERLKELESQLRLKADLTASIRDRFLEDDKIRLETGAHSRYLRATDAPSTCCAVKFDGGLSSDCSVSEFASFVAKTVDVATPILDEIALRFAR